MKDITKMTMSDSMESFFFAETLKYAFLLFAPNSACNLDKVVFTTEGHPVSRGKK